MTNDQEEPTGDASSELQRFEEAAARQGHAPSAIRPEVACDHKHWSMSTHGCYCSGGAIMVDWGN